jgi:uncharacterized OB-fold protein
MTSPPDAAVLAPDRVTDPVDQPFWDAIDQGMFVLACCSQCGRRYARAQACSGCGAPLSAIEWAAADGRGTVKSFCIFEKAYHPFFETMVPYVVAIIRLHEGVDIQTNLIDARLSEVHVGLPVRMVVRLRGPWATHQAVPDSVSAH